jgi:hypothetical protein
MTDLDQWVPTVMLSWIKDDGAAEPLLCQLWISVLGRREWRVIGTMQKPQRMPAIVGTVPMEDEDAAELFSDNAIEF